MNEQPKAAHEMILFAWVGEDDAPPFSGEYGLKQALTPAGMVPLVACKEEKMRLDYIVNQMKGLAGATGKSRMLVRFRFDGVMEVIK